MMWLRRIAAAPLLLLGFIGVVGAVKGFTRQLPDDPIGNAIFASVLVLLTGGATFFLLRPDLIRLRELTFAQFRHWVLTNPLGQAIALYVVAVILMAAMPGYLLGPGFIAMCVYTVAAPWTAALQQRWWAYAGVAFLGFCLLFFFLAGTAEAIARGGFGEAGMIFLVPMEGFPILLAVSGIVRLIRGARPDASSETGPPSE
jgi:hypothetical protein